MDSDTEIDLAIKRVFRHIDKIARNYALLNEFMYCAKYLDILLYKQGNLSTKNNINDQ